MPPTTPAVRRPLPRAALLGSVLGGGLVVVWLFSRSRSYIDLDVYLLGGHAVTHGLDLYGMSTPAKGLLFTYPPFAALVMAPFALLPHDVAVAVWSLLSMTALGGILAVALPGRPTWLRAAWIAAVVLLLAVFCSPVTRTVLLGQVNLFLVLAVLVDLAVPTRPTARWRGVLTGLTAGIKLTPIVFVAHLAVTRQWRAAVGVVAGFLASVAVAFALLPADSADYWGSAVWDTQRVGNDTYVSNQSVTGVLSRAGVEHTTVPWLLLGTAIMLGGLVVARRLHLGGLHVEAVSVVGVAALYASPISWSHHWVWALPLVAATWRRVGWLRGAREVVLPLVLLVFVLAPIWWVPRTGGVETTWTFWQALAGSSYVIAGAALLVYVGVHALRLPPPDATVPGPHRTGAG